MNMLTIVWAQLKGERRYGEIYVMVAALCLAVLSIYLVASLTRTVEQALVKRGAQFIAADMVLSGSEQASDEQLLQAQQYTLEISRQIRFNSMLFGNEQFQLSALQAVDDNYPLRGQLVVADALNAPHYIAAQGPAAGEIWLSPRLAQSLTAEPGDLIELGQIQLRYTLVLDRAPDMGFNLFASFPSALVHIDDLERAQVILPGSRISYRYLFAGDNAALSDYNGWLKSNLTIRQRIVSAEENSSPVGRAITRTKRFMMLGASIGIILACVAISAASKRYAQRQVMQIGLFKASGVQQSRLRTFYILHLTSISLIATVIGIALGQGLLHLMVAQITGLLGVEALVIQHDLKALLVALATGGLASLLFAYPELHTAMRLPAQAALKQRGMLPQSWYRLPLMLTLFTLCAVWLYSGSAKLALAVSGVLVAVVVLLAVIGWLLLITLARLRHGESLVNLTVLTLLKRQRTLLLTLVGLAVAITQVLAISFMKNDLIDEWQNRLPEQAPNRFLINIAEHQRPDIEAQLQSNQVQASEIYPIVRGRLTHINEEALSQAASKENDQRRGIHRDLSLTWTRSLPGKNEITAGDWNWAGDEPQVSVESRVAERLEIKLNDMLTFNVAGQSFDARVTSLRSVDWNTMQPNFYMIMSENLLNRYPHTYLVSLHLPATQHHWLNDALKRYPSITVIDVDQIIDNVRSLIGQAAAAVRWIAYVVFIAGILVMLAQVQQSMDERRKELATYFLLGSTTRRLQSMTALEFILIGLVAGVTACIGAELMLAVLAGFMFDFEFHWHPQLWIYGPLMGIGSALIPSLLMLPTIAQSDYRGIASAD